MNSLSFAEKKKLEKEFRMEGGHVLDFSIKKLDEFFREVVGIEIYEEKYNLGSGSKANRLRAFFSLATDAQLVTFFGGVIDAWDFYSEQSMTESFREFSASFIGRVSGQVESINVSQGSNDINGELSKFLQEELLNLSKLEPQPRGFAFEKFLTKLFDAYGLSAKSSFRITGEQIDGSFKLHNEVYLVEAKWQNLPTPAADLHVFEGKIKEKAAWTRGLFISNSGFTPDGLVAFGRGKRVVCMDGFDLSEILGNNLSLTDVLDEKIRIASEKGCCYVSVRDLFK